MPDSGSNNGENPETMSRYRKLTAICAAAALALGLAACGGGGSSTPPVTDTGDDTKKGTSVVPAPGACTDAACVKHYADALKDARDALAALLKTDYNQSDKNAADEAVAAALKNYNDAVAAQNKYAAAQPPMYDTADKLKALEARTKKPTAQTASTVGGGVTVRNATVSNDTVDGGKVTVLTGTPSANSYSEATWPVGQLAGFDESVWERTIPSEDSVVVYTNIQAATGAKWNTYYAAGAQAAPTTGSASGRKYKPWAGIDTSTAVTAGTGGKGNAITLAGTVTDTTRSLFDFDHGLSDTVRQRNFVDDSKTTNVNESQPKITGKFNGVAGTFACTSNCSLAASHGDGELTTFGGTWTFTPDSNATVAGVDLDADYIDFGYWMQTTTVAGKDSYQAAAFYRGEDPAGNVADVTGSATYKGGAAGLFTRRTFADDGSSSTLTSGGRFTADAELTANFGGGDVGTNDQFSISGTIDQFKDSAGKLIDPAWSLSLMRVKSDSDATPNPWQNNPDAPGAHFTGSTTGGGSWSGNFYGDTGTGSTAIPPHVAGQFTGAFNNGNVMGAFGATKQ